MSQIKNLRKFSRWSIAFKSGRALSLCNTAPQPYQTQHIPYPHNDLLCLQLHIAGSLFFFFFTFKAFHVTHANTEMLCAGVFLWQIRYCGPHNWALVCADSSMPNDLKLGLQMKIDVCCEVTLRHFTVASNGGKTLRKLRQVSQWRSALLSSHCQGGEKFHVTFLECSSFICPYPT